MSKKIKENPMFKNENKKIHGLSSATEEDNEIKRFIIIILVIGLIVGIIYGITEIVNNKKEEKETQEINIDYDKVNVGTLLNRPYDEYYVLVFDSQSLQAMEYSTILSMYKNQYGEMDYIKIYFCDLNSGSNKKYYNVNNDNKSNPNAKTISELDFGDFTLLKIKNGEIAEYIDDYTTIQKKLS